MKRDCVKADPKLFRGRFVVMTFNQELQQPRLVRRQIMIGAIGRTNLSEQRYYSARDFGCHWRAAVDSFFD